MADLQSPISFYPSKTLDHARIQFNISVKAGFKDVENYESIQAFLDIVKTRLETTGAVVEEFTGILADFDTFCGSQREKRLHDTSYGKDNNYLWEPKWED